MAKGFDISIFGDKKLQRKFNALPKTIAKKALRTSMREVANDILADAKARVPVDHNRTRSGKHLKNTLKVRALKRSRKRIGFRISTGTRAELGISPKDKFYYPAAIELGAEGTTPRSFLRTPLKMNSQSGLQKIKRALVRAIRNAKNL